MRESAIKMLGPQAFEYARAISESRLQDATVDIPYAATLVVPPLEYADTVFVVATLTGNTTVPALVGARKGMRVTFAFTQDGTGSRTITWNAQMAFTANGAGTANQKGATTFVFDGTRFVQESGALAFKA